MYLNLQENELSQNIYRIISYDRFIELFSTEKNTLVKPRLWEDTFENLTLKSKLIYPDSTEVEVETHERLYGQCWTTSQASDAMWRIYSPDKRGIRIRTTIDSLLFSLTFALSETPMTETCIGRVRYKSEKKILESAKNAFGDKGILTYDALFNSLLTKRRAFIHENEVRLLYLDKNYDIPNQDLFKYEIDPHKLISQVMIDPRISYEEFKKIKSGIINKTGYKGEIKRSLLYRLPESLTVNLKQNIGISSSKH